VNEAILRAPLPARLPWLLFFILTALSPSKSFAASHTAESFLLLNGLRVVIKKDSSSPLIALQLRVEAGSADEEAEEAGLAHLLEHILFRGSSETGTGKLAGEVEGLGGRINGFTSPDHTVYHMVLPALHYKSGLQILARLVQLPSLDEAQLQKEIQVVLEEWKQGLDNPRSRASTELFRTAYRIHPYARPVIGTPQTLKRITWEVLSRFYRRWYTPNNMTLVVVGNVDGELVKSEINEIFAPLPPRVSASRQRLPEPPQEEPRFNVVKAPVRQSHLMIGFHIPGATAGEAPTLDLLAFILGRGEGSRLAQNVKIAGGLVHSISASTFARKEPSLFVIQAQLEPGKTTDALRGILKEIYRLREEPVTRPELNRAHVNFVRSFVEAKETVQGQAGQLGRFQSLYGNPDHEETYLSEIRQIDAARLKSAARTYFKRENLSLTLLVPEGTAHLPPTDELVALSRSLERPSSATGGAGILTATLENGLRILIREDRRLPLFTVHAGMIGGLLLEDETNNGIHNFIASMLTQGTPRLSTAQLVQEVELLGGMLSGRAGNNMLSLTGTFPSQQAEKGLEIFLDALLEPAFPEQQVEKKRQEILIQIHNREERVRAQAFGLFYRTLFRAHPYRLHPTGQREQLLRLTRENLISHHKNLISPDRMVLTIVGDVDGQNILRHLESRLSPLPKTRLGFSLPSTEDGTSETRVEKKISKTKQSHLVLGFPAPALGEPDYFAMKVLQTILSRIGGRLFVELRDKQGLAYSVGAFSLDDPYQGAFGVYAATDPTAVEKMREGFLDEIRRLHDEEVSQSELDRAKKYLIGNYLIGRQTNESKATDLTFNELFGFGTDFARRYQEGIEKVTAADIQRFARQYLPSDRYALAIVGPEP